MTRCSQLVAKIKVRIPGIYLRSSIEMSLLTLHVKELKRMESNV